MFYTIFVELVVTLITIDGILKHTMRVESTSVNLTKTTGCPVGYIGDDCERPCRSPSYGKDCQSECNCTEEEHCNHVCGCSRTDNKNNSASCTQISRSLHNVCPMRCDNNSDNYDHVINCNVPNFKKNGTCEEKQQHFKLMNTDGLRQCVIISGCIAIFLSVIYAFTFSKGKREPIGNQEVEIIISRDPVFENMDEIRTHGDLEMS